MKEIFIDVLQGSNNTITVTENDNLTETYKLILMKNRIRIDLTNKKVKFVFVKSNSNNGNIFDEMNISNAIEGEVELPITNQISKENGMYSCGLAIYNNEGYLEHTGVFNLYVKENLFEKVSNELIEHNTYKKLISLLDKASDINNKLITNTGEANKVNNTSINLRNALEGEVNRANQVNDTLSKTKNDAVDKNTTLNNSLEEAKKLLTEVGKYNLDNYMRKVDIPSDRDCNSFKEINVFCVFDTGSGDFKNTPEGTLPQGSCRVFLLINRGFTTTRFQQEFINLYPQDRVTRHVRNFNADGNGNWGTWWKVYDEANKPTPNDIGAWSSSDVSQATQPYKVVQRDSTGDVNARLLRSSYQDDNYINGAIAFRTNNKDDNYTRYCNNPSAVREWLSASPSNHNHDNVYLGRKGEINDSTDFNTITEAGMYKVQNITANTPNSPIKAIPNLYAFGILLVFKSNVESEDRVLQIYYPHQAGGSTKIPISRMKNNYDWTPWERVTNGLTASDVGARPSNWNPTWDDVQNKPSKFPPSDHNHDGRYLPLVNGSTNESYKLQKKFIEVGADDTKIVELGVGPTDTYIHNTKSNKYLALKDDGRLFYNNKEVCDRGHFTGDPGLNGYQMFPSGLLVQWGYVDMGKDTTKLVNFPKSFKDNNYNLQVSVYGGPGRVPAVKTYNAKNNNFYIQCEAGFCVYWEAKGSV